MSNIMGGPSENFHTKLLLKVFSFMHFFSPLYRINYMIVRALLVCKLYHSLFSFPMLLQWSLLFFFFNDINFYLVLTLFSVYFYYAKVLLQSNITDNFTVVEFNFSTRSLCWQTVCLWKMKVLHIFFVYVFVWNRGLYRRHRYVCK